MWREAGSGKAIASGALVLGVLALAGLGITQVASRQWRVQRTFEIRSDFPNIAGIDAGARVRLQGIDAGVVQSVAPPSTPGGKVRLVFRVDERLRSLIRVDATARIVAEGIVGARVVEIVPGQPDAEPLASNGVITAERPLELGDLLAKAQASLARIDAVAVAAERGLLEINAIAATIRKGEGSLGKFVQEDEAYRKFVGLSERGDRTLHDLEENLAALKRTWPISRYFNDRSFFDRERVLFHPGAERESRTIRDEELFETGRSVLTADGRRKLDEVGAWFKKVKRPASEVVIAAFSNDLGDADLAQMLTQEQAETVRKYLVSRYAIDSLGWFNSRKVAAVGFGSEVPRSHAEASRNQPPKRVEIILFTPQA